MRQPKVCIARLRQYKRDDGSSYFKGWAGDAVYLLLKSDAEPDYGSIAVWDLLVEQRPPKTQGGSVASKGKHAASSASLGRSKPARKTHRAVPLKEDRPAAHPNLNDEIGF